jgi:hypothetical protein
VYRTVDKLRFLKGHVSLFLSLNKSESFRLFRIGTPAPNNTTFVPRIDKTAKVSNILTKHYDVAEVCIVPLISNGVLCYRHCHIFRVYLLEAITFPVFPRAIIASKWIKR